MHCRVPITNSLFMMSKTFKTFFSNFEHIAKRERATYETPAFAIRHNATVAGVPVAVRLINLVLFKEIIYFHNNLFLGGYYLFTSSIKS